MWFVLLLQILILLLYLYFFFFPSRRPINQEDIINMRVMKPCMVKVISSTKGKLDKLLIFRMCEE